MSLSLSSASTTESPSESIGTHVAVTLNTALLTASDELKCVISKKSVKWV